MSDKLSVRSATMSDKLSVQSATMSDKLSVRSATMSDKLSVLSATMSDKLYSFPHLRGCVVLELRVTRKVGLGRSQLYNAVLECSVICAGCNVLV
jgi:hypothetical protein